LTFKIIRGLHPMGHGELYPHEPTQLTPPTAHVVDLTAR
jgi:hypothetical protein